MHICELLFMSILPISQTWLAPDAITIWIIGGWDCYEPFLFSDWCPQTPFSSTQSQRDGFSVGHLPVSYYLSYLNNSLSVMAFWCMCPSAQTLSCFMSVTERNPMINLLALLQAMISKCLPRYTVHLDHNHIWILIKRFSFLSLSFFFFFKT